MDGLAQFVYFFIYILIQVTRFPQNLVSAGSLYWWDLVVVYFCRSSPDPRWLPELDSGVLKASLSSIVKGSKLLWGDSSRGFDSRLGDLCLRWFDSRLGDVCSPLVLCWFNFRLGEFCSFGYTRWFGSWLTALLVLFSLHQAILWHMCCLFSASQKVQLCSAGVWALKSISNHSNCLSTLADLNEHSRNSFSFASFCIFNSIDALPV